MRIFSLGGLIGPVLLTAVIGICSTLRPDYSHVQNFISELGATGTTNAWIMNYAGFVPTGLLLAAFGASLAVVIPRSRLTIAAATLLGLFGTGIFLSGFISCDPGCPQVGGSFENLLHDRIAPISFLLAIIGIALMAIRFRSLPDWRQLSPYSFATSATALVFLILLARSLEIRDLTGLWQRLLVMVLFTWCAIVGLRAFRQPSTLRG